LQQAEGFASDVDGAPISGYSNVNWNALRAQITSSSASTLTALRMVGAMSMMHRGKTSRPR
jgi:hypothetical protein